MGSPAPQAFGGPDSTFGLRKNFGAVARSSCFTFCFFALPPMYALRCISQREVQPIDSTARATRGGSWRERSPWLNCPALYMRSLTASHALSGSMSSGCWISSMISRTSATLGGHLFVAMCFFTASATIPDSSCSNIMAQRFTVASIAFASLNLSKFG